VAARANKEKIDQFKADVALLESMGRTRAEIADKIGVKKPMDDANFSKYYNEKDTHPITENFLRKFYKSWGEVLNTEKKKGKDARKEKEAGYPTGTSASEFLIEEEKNDDRGSYIAFLEGTNVRLQKLVDDCLTFIRQQGGKFGKPPADQ